MDAIVMKPNHRKTTKRSVFKKAAQAGALLGAMGLWSASPAWAADYLSPNAKSNQATFMSRAQNADDESGWLAPISYQDPGAPAATVPLPPDTPAPVVAPAPAAEAPPADDKPWTAQEALFGGTCVGDWMACRKITFGAWTVQAYTINFQHPNNRFNGPVTWLDRSNEYQFTNQWMFIEKATDTTEQDFDYGYRCDAEWGSSSRFTTSTGLDDSWVSSYSFYGWAMPQAYIETKYKKLSVKWGHFVSPVGYFTVNTALNFFNTLPYTYQYGEPFTHTGAIATWNVTDNLILGGAITRGWDNTGNWNYNPGYLTTASYTFQDKSNLAYVQVFGPEWGSTNANARSFRYFQTLVYSRPISERWNYVAQSDYGKQWETTTASGSATWYGLNQYIYYTVNQCWTWGLNFEWFRDQDGFRVGGFLPTLTSGPFTNPPSQSRGLPTTFSGYKGSFFQFTIGPKWTPNKNLTVRPSFRYDIFDGIERTDPLSFNGGGPGSAQFGQLKPFNDGKSNHQGILATDVIINY